MRDKMRNLDLEVQEMTATEYAAVVKADYERWRSIIKASGFSTDSE
jgi:tripartite-type tricarboxylate transporter receptor subunit TctC